MLAKQNIPIQFSQGLDTKTDPFQVPIGKMLKLTNVVFTKGGLYGKRNGFPQLANLSSSNFSYVSTFGSSLVSVGNFLSVYSSGSQSWVDKGPIQPLSLSVLPLIRSNTNQSQCDISVSGNGLICTVYTDNVPVSGSNVLVYKYAVSDSATGQSIISPATITSTGTVTNAPRVFLLGNYFIIVFDTVISGTNHLQYFSINTANLNIGTATDISTQYTPAATGSFDGVVANGNLYLAWNGSDIGSAIRMTFIDSTLTQHATVTFTSRVATHMSLCADTTSSTPVIYAAFYDGGSTTGYILAVNQNLTTILAPTQFISAGPIWNVTATAANGVVTTFYEVQNAYSYDSGIPTHFINTRTCTQAGTLGSATTVIRSVGLASKAFILNGNTYFLATYSSAYQPTYFLSNSSGKVIAKLASSNGGGYVATGLYSVSVIGNSAYVPYLFKDLVTSVNKTQGVASATGIYSQTGINVASISLGTTALNSTEIGNNLHLSGGFLWSYDGVAPVENGFHFYPEYVETTPSSSGGSMTTQDYFYQVTYEWTDNQGNIFRSSPSIPVKVASGSLTGSSNSVTVNIPTLRLTYKTATPIKIVIYRWSTAQQVYYQVTSLTTPLLNSVSVDSVSFIDTQVDSAILGNAILYTTGGVIENISAPACSSLTKFKSRFVLVDAEDKNLLWYSKQVVEATPVELSDLFTLYLGSGVSNLEDTVVCEMDDKLIIFKKNKIFYLVGNGPDNTGANNDFSDPIPVITPVGCQNQRSVVVIPQGIMFQSSQGIWILGRDLSINYIGSPVERYNSDTVLSAVSIPGTTQVRFNLSSGTTLMYDYFFGQWGTFKNVSGVSSAIYQNLHTFINSSGQVYQESPGTYLDGSKPVLMSFTTGWINLAGLQGFQRAKEFYFLGNYISPHKLNVSIAYDYNSSPTQTNIISPTNFSETYGDDTIYGGGEYYGGQPTLEQERIFLQQQKCQSFQITVQEIFDSTLGTIAGAGLTFSGIDLTVGLKGQSPKLPASKAVG